MKRSLWVLLLLAAFILAGCSHQPPAPLSAKDLQAIATVVGRETSMPIRSIRPESNGRAVVFVSDGTLGRMEFKLSRHEADWQVVDSTCFF